MTDRTVTARATRRVRVEGDLFHGRIPDGAVYIGRPAPGLRGSPYANPYRRGDTIIPATAPHGDRVRSAAHAVALFREDLREAPELVARARRDLAGRDLACWCRVGAPCHGDVLLSVVAGDAP
jgi:hypothetical protein